MAIKYFKFSPELIESFVRFSYDLYRGDANCIPPLRKELYAQLSPEFPYYQKSGNHHRHYLATSGRKIVGRISAMVNSDLRDGEGTPVGTVGFFECIQDYAVAQELLDSAIQWLQSEHNITRIWGPMNFDIWHGYRFMTHGFDQKLFYGEPYNKPYYRDFFERYGFTAKQIWDSVEINGRSHLEKINEKGAERYKELVESGYRFEQFDLQKFKEDLQKLHSILTQTFKEFIGFTPISFIEFEKIFTKTRYAFHPQLFSFVYNQGNALAGFAGAFLELSDAIRGINGKDNLFAKLKFLSYRRGVERILFYIIGVSPEEAVKSVGLGRAMFCYIINQILKCGYETVIFALMARGNKVQGLLGEYMSKAQRSYTLYELRQ